MSEVEKLCERLREILKGIDQDQVDSEHGWWETSAGVDFGAQKLAELEALFTAQAEQIAVLREGLNKIAEGRTISFTGSVHRNRPLRDKDAQKIARAALASVQTNK